MNVEIKVRPARAEDADDLAPRLRKADVEEIWAVGGGEPADEIRQSLAQSTVSFTVLINDRPEIVFGVGMVNVLGGVGAPWMVGTDRMIHVQRQFLQQSRPFLQRLFVGYNLFRNVVHDKNKMSLRWLSWLGAEFSEPMPIGRDGEMLRIFEMRP